MLPGARPRAMRTTPQATSRHSPTTASSARALVRVRSAQSSTSDSLPMAPPRARRCGARPADVHASDLGEHAQMGGDAARQRAEVVATLQARHDAPLCVPLRQLLQALRHPLVVGFDQAELAEPVPPGALEA